MDGNYPFLNRMSLEKKSSLGSYAIQYNTIAQNLREALLYQAGDREMSRLEIVKEIFRQIDGNDSGVLTSREMMSFLIHPDLHLFDQNPQHAEKFCSLLLEQIDEDGDGSISLEELASFLFPEDFQVEPMEFEPGIVYDLARRELVQFVSSTVGNEELMLQQFASLAEGSVRKGHLENRIAKKALMNLFIPHFQRNLKEPEADCVVRKLDADSHGRISAKAFKQWLFPANNYEETMKQATYLYGIIREKYQGEPKALFETWKSYGAECIYKPDFITNIKAADPSLSRQEAQELCNALCSGEKFITYSNLIDFLGYCEDYERQEEDDTIYNLAHSQPLSTTAVAPPASSSASINSAMPTEDTGLVTTPLTNSENGFLSPGQPAATTTSFPENTASFKGPNTMSSSTTSTTSFSRMSLEKKNSLHQYAHQYNMIAQQLREALVRLAGDRELSHYELVKEAFALIDVNDSGVLTIHEMLSFLKLPELGLFEADPTNAEKFSQLLLEQIDENNDQTISLEELATFIFPEDFNAEPLEYEPGIVYDFARRVLVQKIGQVGTAAGSEEILLQEFANLAKATVRKSYLEERNTKKALMNVYIPQFHRNLNEEEAELIMRKLDVDRHGRISAKAFKQWLFPANNYEETMKHARYFYGIIQQKYQSRPKTLFENWKSYGAECIYKPDFITNIKAADPSLSRQEAQELCNALCSGEKFITYSNLIDFLGYCEDYERQEEDDELCASAPPQRRLSITPENMIVKSTSGDSATHPHPDTASSSSGLAAAGNTIPRQRSTDLPLTSDPAFSTPVREPQLLSNSNSNSGGGATTTNTNPQLLQRQNASTMLQVQPLSIPSNDDVASSVTNSNLSSPRNSSVPDSNYHQYQYSMASSTPRKRSPYATATSPTAIPRTPSLKKPGSSSGMSTAKSVQFDQFPMTPSRGNSLALSSTMATTTTTTGTISNYAKKYNRVVQELREALLRLSGDRDMHHIDIVKEVFRQIDGNDSGVLTAHEMLSFLKLPQLRLFEEEDPTNAEKFCQLLLEQIDENGDGTISFEELASFIFPDDFSSSNNTGNSTHHTGGSHGGIKMANLEYEPGIVYDLTRKALLQVIGPAATQGSDDLLLQEFAKLAKTTIRKGQLEDRNVKKALQHLTIPQFQRTLTPIEAELILHKLDIDHHGRVSVKAFKQFLFPVNNLEEKTKQANYLYEVIRGRFHGNPRELFTTCQSYGAECIYKADFITHMKAIDPNRSRVEIQELANTLCGGEKAITFKNLIDFLEYSPEFEEACQNGTIGQSYSNDGDDVAEGEEVENRDLNRGSSSAEGGEEEEDDLHSLRRDIEEAQRRSRNPSFVDNTNNLNLQGLPVTAAAVNMMEDISRRYGIGNTQSHNETAQPSTSMTAPQTPKPRQITPPGRLPSSDASSVGGHGSVASQKKVKKTVPGPPPISAEERAYIQQLLSTTPSSVLIPQSPLQRSATLRRSFSDDDSSPSRKDSSNHLYNTFPPRPPAEFETAKSQTMGEIGLFSSSSLRKSISSRDQEPKDPSAVRYGAVGYSAKELTSFGFTNHSGKWRGFPYDSFSCCNTSHFHCPLKPSGKKTPKPVTHKKPRMTASESLTEYLEKKMKLKEKRSKSPKSFVPAGSTTNLYTTGGINTVKSMSLRSSNPQSTRLREKKLSSSARF